MNLEQLKQDIDKCKGYTVYEPVKELISEYEFIRGVMGDWLEENDSKAQVVKQIIISIRSELLNEVNEVQNEYVKHYTT